MPQSWAIKTPTIEKRVFIFKTVNPFIQLKHNAEIQSINPRTEELRVWNGREHLGPDNHIPLHHSPPRLSEGLLGDPRGLLTLRRGNLTRRNLIVRSNLQRAERHTAHPYSCPLRLRKNFVGSSVCEQVKQYEKIGKKRLYISTEMILEQLHCKGDEAEQQNMSRDFEVLL